MLCPSNINNKHNSRHGNNNSNKSVTTARTQWQEEREGRWERGGTEGRRQGPAKTKAKSVGRQQKYKHKWQLTRVASLLRGGRREKGRQREGGWGRQARELFVCTLRNLFYCCLANKFHKFPAGSQTPLNFGRHLKESCRLAFWIITRTQRQQAQTDGGEKGVEG